MTTLIQSNVTPNEPDQEVIRSYLVDCELRQYTAETIRGYHSNLRTISCFLMRIGQSYLTLDNEALKKTLNYLINERKVTQKTRECYFTTLSSFYEYLEYEGLYSSNPIPGFQKRYLKQYKQNGPESHRQLISVEQMAQLINYTLEIRDKVLMTILAKTGVRRGELISMDIGDINWETQSIKLKPKTKRSNLYVYFDNEASLILQRWLRIRTNYAKPGVKALFIGDKGQRIGRNIVYNIVTKHATRMGLHNPESNKLEDHFSPHCFRHWFTTHLRRNGMSREFIKELRGDARKEAIDIYDHIDHQELRKAYLAAIPRLGII